MHPEIPGLFPVDAGKTPRRAGLFGGGASHFFVRTLSAPSRGSLPKV